MKKLLTMISAAFAVHAAFGGDYPYCAWGNREPGNEMQTWFLSE